ncbi:type VI secretion system baseplate subunit TssE [Frischella perrara]|uniref:Type VI secretion system baseplate subunit TssE n=1 Tax=Frischella perrara TaxID=1267021 RepID=A0A318MVL2_FRIPE|nr:type VI secretion system baseplate subunit TssE [Frischella perrara]PXY94637.1 type VI secretion system baseplate subunit TssE [Frischella perrara]
MAALLRWKKDQQQSLFDRIYTESNIDDYQISNSRIDSIKLNLSKILNCRPGSSQSTKNIGVVDLNDATMGTSEIKANICRAIKNCIEQYEPRIIQVKVTALANDIDLLTMEFDIQAVIKDDLGTDSIEFKIHYDNKQRYILE